MTPVMEVLDGRCTSTPNGVPSPVVDPSLPHLDLGGLSPSKGCVSRECSPERGSPNPSSPRPLQGSSPTLPKEEHGEEEEEEEEDVASREASPEEFRNPISDDPLQEADAIRLIESDQRGASPTYTATHGNLHLNPPPLTPREEEPALEEGIIENNEERKEEEEEEEVEAGESPTNFRINSVHRSMLCANEEKELEPNSYSLNSSVLDGRISPPSREDDLPYSEDQESTDPDLPEHPHHGIDATSSLGEHSQQLSESGSLLSSEDLRHQQNLLDDHHRHSLQEAHNHLEEHQAHLHQQYNDQQHCHMQDEYEYPMLKIPSHLQEHMRDQQSHLHDYNEHHHSLEDQRHHLQDPMGDHLQHLHHHHHPPPERSHGYWNMHLGMISKVKSEAKEWYEREGMVSEALGNTGLLKSPDQHDLYNSYRIPSHPSLGSESPRPSPLPHGGLPFSQSPDPRQHQQAQHQQHYQAYQNHSGMRDMSPMSPKFQGHPRAHLQPTQHHGASQLPGPQHHVVQHPGLQHPAQHHPGNHLQQQYSQQYGGQQQLGLQAHHGQQLASPYAQGLMAGIGGPGGHRVHEGREGREGDPYSFVDEYTGPPPRPVEEILGHSQPKRRGRKPKHIKLMENGGDPLAIAAAQAAHEAKKRKWRQMGPDGKPLPLPVKPRKRIDRFDGISEDELSKKILPDHLGPNLDIVIVSCNSFFREEIGINPGLFAAYKGHHYAGPGNHFWKCLYLSGLIPEPLTSDDDHQLLDHGIGFTNIVSRTTRGSAELTRKEIKEGGQILLAKLQRFQPRVAVFNGKGIYEIFSGKKEFTFGRQPEKIEGTHTHVWVMPSSSARCAQLPRALDKVPFYTALRKFRDFLKGTITELTEEEVTFTCPKTTRHLKDCEKLDGVLDDDLCDPFLEDSLKDDLESSRFESDLDSEEISRSISQSLYNLSGMTREQLEALDCPTIPIRKKRGRPKKAPDDPNAPPRPKARSFPTELLMCNGEEPPRKKRGRPKKVLEDGSIPTPKRPGRKPKALKEMLATQQGPLGGPGIPQNPHSQMAMGHINGMMSPSGYNPNPNAPPFSPQFGGPQVHPMNGPTHPGDLMSSVHGVGTPNALGMGNHPGLSGSLNPMHSGHGPMLPGPGMASLHSQGCPTPNSSSGAHTPVHNSLPPRGHTPQGFGQSPGYSPSPVPSHLHHMNSVYGHHSEKSSELLLEEERQLGISPIPASPGMAQPDFEPPTSLPEGEPIIGEGRSISSHQEEPTPSIPSQFSNPGTPADENAPSYQGYSNYPPPSCSPKYNSNITPSPSYPPGVSQSPSFPPSVSCSPSYTPHNTHSPSYPPNSTHSPSYHQTIAQSPSYPPNSTQSPSYPRNTTQSPSYPPNPSRSPSYHAPPNQSPSFPPVTQSPSYPSNTSQSPSYPPNISQSPSYSTLTRSPSYPTNLTQSPSYATNSTQSPSYHPPTSQSPSFHSAPTLSPSLNKPIVPGVHSPQMKSDVSSKSLSGLESLVDQIPSLNEGDNGPLTNGPCSNPTTPGPPNDPFSPGHGPQNSSFQSYTGGGSSFPNTHYGSPQPSNPYSPQFTSSSTNLSTNFSVSSLASSSSSSLTSSQPYDSGNNSSCITTPTTTSNTAVSSSSSSTSFSVSSLTGGSPTPTPTMYSNSYSPAPPGPSPHSYDVMGSSILPPTPPMGSSFMGSSSMGSSMSGFPASGSQLPYHYPQYGESGPGSYAGPGHSSFPYGSSSGFHVPSPRFPYPSPYPGGPYSQGYSQNAMLERIKQTGMGFGSF